MDPRTIAITRPMGKGKDTAEIVRSLGWLPFIFHTVELRPLEGQKIREQVLSSLMQGPVDWMVFMSTTGVNLLFDNVPSEAKLREHMHGTRFLAVGPRTREALLHHGVKQVPVPDKYSSTGVDQFFARIDPENLRVVLIRSSSADDSLSKSLTNRGATVATINAYESNVPTDLRTAYDFLEALSERRFDAILFTSAVSVSNLFEIAKPKIKETKLIRLLKTARVGAIGPATATELRGQGIESIVPEEYLIESALRKLITEPAVLQHNTLVS